MENNQTDNINTQESVAILDELQFDS